MAKEKKVKVESPEHIEIRHQKEAKELSRRRAQQAKPLPKHYFLVLIIVLAIIYCVDEITSNINSTMQPYIVFDFFNITSMSVSDPEYTAAIDKMFIISMMSVIVMFVGPFYKSLADKYGRRLFLMINTVTFGIGLLIIMIAPSIYFYIIGYCLLSFVTPNDVQVMYIMETAPKEKRATLSFATKAIALVSVSLIGVWFKAFYNAADVTSWRKVYIIPVIAAIAIGLASILFTRETPVFIDGRINYLVKTDEERAEEARMAKESASASKGGVFNAIKFIFTHKQIRAVAITALLFSVATIYTSYYSTILNIKFSQEAIAIALIIYPFCNGATTFAAGFLSDKLGRKKSCLLLGSLAMLMLLVFVISCQFGISSILAGIAYGISIGGLWSMSDTLFLTMPAESVPTNLRASVMGTMSLLLGIGMMVGAVVFVVLQNFIPYGWLCLGLCVPFMAIAIIVLFTKVHETKDVDMDTVTGLEWD